MTWWRSVFLVGALLFIAAATLTPGDTLAVGEIRPDFWCMACGRDGGADITLNIALFVPLGIALALVGMSPARAFLMGLLLSAAIECTQHFGVPPGRVASFSDLVTNSGGAFVGAFLAWKRVWWFAPSRTVARRLSIFSLIAIPAFLGFTAWALGRDVKRGSDPAASTSSGSLRQMLGAFAAGYGWYHGQVIQAEIEGTEYKHTGDGPLMFFGAINEDVRGAVQVIGRDERREYVPFLTVQGNFPLNAELMLGQQNMDARLRVRLRGSRLRLPAPELGLRDAFSSERIAKQTFAFVVSPEQWKLASVAGPSSLDATLPITLSLGWTLFQTVVHVGDRLGNLVTWSWLFVLWLPMGYWCAFAGGLNPESLKQRSTQNTGRWYFVVIGCTSAFLTLALVPGLAGIGSTLLKEWIVSAAGLAAGVFFATRSNNFSATK